MKRDKNYDLRLYLCLNFEGLLVVILFESNFCCFEWDFINYLAISTDEFIVLFQNVDIVNDKAGFWFGVFVKRFFRFFTFPKKQTIMLNLNKWHDKTFNLNLTVEFIIMYWVLFFHFCTLYSIRYRIKFNFKILFSTESKKPKSMIN